MSLPLHLTERFCWLRNTLLFFRNHALVIFGLGLVAALGRVMQLGGFGTVSTIANFWLEIMIESVRIALFLYVLGLANLKTGWLRLSHFLTHNRKWKYIGQTAWQNIRRHWPALLLNTGAVLMLAAALNYLIDLTAYETCFLLQLKEGGILSAASSEWTILLFLKNLSVIPLVLVFDALLLLWAIDRRMLYEAAIERG